MDVANMQVDLSAPDDIALADRMKHGQDRIRQELRKLIIGQDAVLNEVLLTLFVGGNSLIIGVPGLAKTLLIHTLARVVDLKFSRIQFTPDLMPSDITGTDIIQEDPATGRRQCANHHRAAEGDRRQRRHHRADTDRTVRRRELPARGRTGPREDAAHLHAVARAGPQVLAHPVHAGPHAVRRDRHGRHPG